MWRQWLKLMPAQNYSGVNALPHQTTQITYLTFNQLPNQPTNRISDVSSNLPISQSVYFKLVSFSRLNLFWLTQSWSSGVHWHLTYSFRSIELAHNELSLWISLLNLLSVSIKETLNSVLFSDTNCALLTCTFKWNCWMLQLLWAARYQPNARVENKHLKLFLQVRTLGSGSVAVASIHLLPLNWIQVPWFFIFKYIFKETETDIA